MKGLSTKTWAQVFAYSWLAMYFVMSILSMMQAVLPLRTLSSLSSIYPLVLHPSIRLFTGRWLLWTLEFPLSSDGITQGAMNALTYMDVWVFSMAILLVFYPTKTELVSRLKVNVQNLFICFLISNFIFFAGQFYAVVAMFPTNALRLLVVVFWLLLGVTMVAIVVITRMFWDLWNDFIVQ